MINVGISMVVGILLGRFLGVRYVFLGELEVVGSGSKPSQGLGLWGFGW